jgi:hypothetical protein
VVKILHAALYEFTQGETENGVADLTEATALLENLINYKG